MACKQCAVLELELEIAINLLQTYLDLNKNIRLGAASLVDIVKPLADISEKIHAVAEEISPIKQLQKE